MNSRSGGTTIGQDAPVRIHHRVLPNGQDEASSPSTADSPWTRGKASGVEYVCTDKFGRFVKPRNILRTHGKYHGGTRIAQGCKRLASTSAIGFQHPELVTQGVLNVITDRIQ